MLHSLDNDRIAFTLHFECAQRAVRGLGSNGKDFVEATSKTAPGTIAYVSLGSSFPSMACAQRRDLGATRLLLVVLGDLNPLSLHHPPHEPHRLLHLRRALLERLALLGRHAQQQAAARL